MYFRKIEWHSIFRKSFHTFRHMFTSYPKSKLNILLLENIDQEAVAVFRQHGYENITLLKSSLSEEELVSRIGHVHILGIRSKTQITANVVEAAKKLLGIGCFCIGTNQVDMFIGCAQRHSGV